jgi:hypothetical protein
MIPDKEYWFGDEMIMAPGTLSTDEVRDVWKLIHPSLERAKATAETTNRIRFVIPPDASDFEFEAESPEIETDPDTCQACGKKGEVRGLACICPGCGHTIWGC